MMNRIFWIFLMVMALCSCSGKGNESVRADRPDTVVLKAGPDSALAVVGAGSTADRMQLLLKFQHEFPDTVSVTLPDTLRHKGGKDKGGEKEKTVFAVGKVVKAVISREESGEYVLHALTDVTEPFVKACDRFMGTWTTPDSLALTLTVAKGGVASADHASKLHYSGWRFRNFDFSAILLTGEGNVCDTAMVTDGKLALHTKRGKGAVKIVTFVRQIQKGK